MSFVLVTALAGLVSAEDSEKQKVKIDGRDPVTGEKIKVRSKTKAESDGDYKEKTDVHVGKTHTKRRVDAEGDGDLKAKEKVHGPDGKYESKTKIDK